MRLQDIMSRDIKTLPSTATVSEARTTTDVLELLGGGIDRPAAGGQQRTLRDRVPRRSGPSARHARGG